jgi:hypothetical protein
VIGGVLLLACVVACVVALLWRRRRRAAEAASDYDPLAIAFTMPADEPRRVSLDVASGLLTPRPATPDPHAMPRESLYAGPPPDSELPQY